MQRLRLSLMTFFPEIEPLQEWEYLPPVGPRPKGGFSGLKNAGATCYMNSVLQQLFMVPSIRLGILSASGACLDPNEDFSGELDNRVSLIGFTFRSEIKIKSSQVVSELQNDEGNGRRNYHIGILKHVQAIFAHLGHSVHQFYIPRGLWGHFK
jgi:ubiquitin carboxyl-terminal hydrolase 9/24